MAFGLLILLNIINHRFTKKLKENSGFGSGEHYSFRYFTKNALVTKLPPKLSGYFWLLQA